MIYSSQFICYIQKKCHFWHLWPCKWPLMALKDGRLFFCDQNPTRRHQLPIFRHPTWYSSQFICCIWAKCHFWHLWPCKWPKMALKDAWLLFCDRNHIRRPRLPIFRHPTCYSSQFVYCILQKCHLWHFWAIYGPPGHISAMSKCFFAWIAYLGF